MSEFDTHHSITDKRITFDISITKKCNFRCSYCYAKNDLKNETMSAENLSKMIHFIKNIQETYYSLDEWKTQLNIYGGEPLLALEELAYLTNILRNYHFVIVTNGSLINQYIDKINKIYRKNENLFFNVSYDYLFQNETRQSGTYNLIRNNIKLLDENNIKSHTITTFTANNIEYFYDMIIDWYELRKEIKNTNTLNFCYNIDDNLVSDDANLDEDKIIQSFSKAKKFLEDNNIKNEVRYNSGYGTKQDVKTAKELASDTVKHICAINENGAIYTGIRLLFLPDEIRESDKYGTLDDDMETILANKDIILNKIKKSRPVGSSKCSKCPNFCKPLLARTLTIANGDITKTNRKYSDTWCRIHDLLHEYDLQ